MPKSTDWVARLKNLRSIYGWSQKELAEQFRVSPGAVGLWETEERKVSGPVTLLIEIFEERAKASKKKRN